MLTDLNPDPGGSNPSHLTIYDDKLFFSANDGINGTELWAYDGSNVSMVMDLTDPSVKAVNQSHSSGVRHLTVMGNLLFFQANDGISGPELWAYSASSQTASLVADIRPGSTGSFPEEFFAWPEDARIYFTASDGSRGLELWASDGTAAGTTLVKDINPGPAGSEPYDHQTYASLSGTRIYFEANDGIHGYELWASDGTVSGTTLVLDLNPGPNSAFPNDMAEYGNLLYFQADNGSTGVELWYTDGTAAGTALASAINPTGNSNPNDLYVHNGLLYFRANDGSSGNELWFYDRNSLEAVQAADINKTPGLPGAIPLFFLGYDDTIYFNADDGLSGRELWSYCTSSGEVIQAADMNATIPSLSSDSNPNYLIVFPYNP